jgi:hypothetical protein
VSSPTPPTTNVVSLPRHDDTEQRLLFKTAALIATGLGVGGVDWVSDTSAHVGHWWVFHAVTASVITDIQYKAGTSTGFPTGVTLAAGDRIYGDIISLTLASGIGELYRATA